MCTRNTDVTLSNCPDCVLWSHASCSVSNHLIWVDVAVGSWGGVHPEWLFDCPSGWGRRPYALCSRIIICYCCRRNWSSWKLRWLLSLRWGALVAPWPVWVRNSTTAWAVAMVTICIAISSRIQPSVKWVISVDGCKNVLLMYAFGFLSFIAMYATINVCKLNARQMSYIVPHKTFPLPRETSMRYPVLMQRESCQSS